MRKIFKMIGIYIVAIIGLIFIQILFLQDNNEYY